MTLRNNVNDGERRKGENVGKTTLGIQIGKRKFLAFKVFPLSLQKNKFLLPFSLSLSIYRFEEIIQRDVSKRHKKDVDFRVPSCMRMT